VPFRTSLLLVVSLVLVHAVDSRADWVQFQEGNSQYPYSSTHTTSVLYGTDHNFGISPILHVDDGTYATLIRFPDMIGTNPGQLPPGSTIYSTRLWFAKFSANQTVYVDVHPVYVPWDEATLTGNVWATLPEPRFGPSVGTILEIPQQPSTDVSVTSVVQDWVNGTPNWGFILRIDLGGASGALVEYYSEDHDGLGPGLVVEYAPPPVLPVQASTWGRIKALYR
jgi:hypothetical protein